MYLTVSYESRTGECEKSIKNNDKFIRIANKHIFLTKLVLRWYYFPIYFTTMDNKKCSINDVMKQLKVINGQNMLILTQNQEIKDELSKLKIEMVKRVEEVEAEIEGFKLDIGAIKKSQDFQNGQFQNHKLVQENIQSNHIKLEKNLLIYENRILNLEREALDEKLARNYMENNSRKLNLEITGIPAVADENCKKLVNV